MTTTTDRTTGRLLGEAAKASAHGVLAARRAALVLRGRRALLEVLLARGEGSADDVRDVVELPTGVDAKAFGVVPAELARSGIIRAAGYLRTARPTAHARALTRWVLVNRSAAEQWLREHPETPAGSGLADIPSHGPVDGQQPGPPSGERQRVLFREGD